jgi:4-hydroxy-tetrahydrodipicolinate synthase
MTRKIYQGVFAAAVTPLKTDFSPDIDAVPEFLSFLAQRGCHGVLILGTTGEGPSFSFQERKMIFQAANEVRKVHPEFLLLAGTGSPSLQETINFTRLAFDLGLDGVVVLPPYYYKNITEEGLYLWFSDVIDKAVPADGAFFGYHIPQISNVSLSIELLKRLKDEYPDQFNGLKNSSTDPSFAIQLGESFGDDLTVFTGNDRLFSLSLEANASGCITALANLVSPDLRTVWDAFQGGRSTLEVQERLNLTRTIFDRYPPAAAVIKSMLSRCHGLPKWNVRQPLIPLPEDLEEQILADLGWDCY